VEVEEEEDDDDGNDNDNNNDFNRTIEKLMADSDAHEAGLQQRIQRQRTRATRSTRIRLEQRLKNRCRNTLLSVPEFAQLPPNNIKAILATMKHHRYTKGEAICKQGDDADFMGIIVSGSCSVTVGTGPGGLIPIRVATLGELQYFGETAIAGGDVYEDVYDPMNTPTPKRTATVIVESESAELLRLERKQVARLAERGLLSATSLDKIKGVRNQRREENAMMAAAVQEES
jgi:CRP-like cAMP-binding protein